MGNGVLIVRKFGSIGDMLMMTPAIRLLSKREKTKIDIAAQKQFFDVFKNNEFVGKLIPLNSSYNNDYSNVINLSDYEFNYEQTHQPFIEKTKIELFCEAVGEKCIDTRLDIFLASSEKEKVCRWLKERKIQPKRFIVLAVNSANPTRNWPLEKWKKLAEEATKKTDMRIVVADKETCWKANKKVFFFNSKGIRELFALINESALVITPDSGALHIAGALEKKCISIFGPTDPAMRVLYKNSRFIRKDVGCNPCWYKRCEKRFCLEMISVDEVLQKMLEEIN